MTIGAGFPEVLAAARTGAEWAWTRLYRDLSPPVLGYLRARGAAEPEDLLSEVFVQVVRGISRFEGDEAGFRSWVFMIAHHRAQDERRVRAREAARRSWGDPPEVAADTDVESDASSSVETESIRAVLRELPPAQRDVLLLRILGGLTVAEAAAVTGRTVGATKALQRRGLARLARILEYRTVPLLS